MDISFYYLALAAFVIAGTFGTFFYFYKRKQTARLVDLYKKLEVSETSARKIKEQFFKLQEEAVSLRETLARNQRFQEEKTTGLLETGRKKLISIGVASVLAGIFLGGTMAGVMTYSLSEIKHTKHSIDYQVSAKVNEAKAEMFREELDRVNAQYQMLSQQLFSTREGAAVINAKLEILLNQLSGKRMGSKLSLDVEALRESLQDTPNSAQGGARSLFNAAALKV